MPTTVYAETNDALLGYSSALFGGARGGALTTGNQRLATATAYNFGVYVRYLSGRGGNTYYIKRSFFEFDLSGESGTVESAEVKIVLDNLGSSGNPAKVIMVKATALADSTADYGNVFSSLATLGTTYSDVITPSTTVGYHTFTMTSDAISDINDAVGSGNFTLGLMSYSYDHQNFAPSLGGNYCQTLVRYSDYSGTSSDPKLELTYETAVTDNATFFGTNF